MLSSGLTVCQQFLEISAFFVDRDYSLIKNIHTLIFFWGGRATNTAELSLVLVIAVSR